MQSLSPGFIKKTPPADSTATEDLRKTELLSCDLVVQSKSLGASSNALVDQNAFYVGEPPEPLWLGATTHCLYDPST
ncbi:hypothetical protein NC652_001144 [Populus alba x Populus x berolinensis]|nr:hypothetical protein NC652_001144 [Populus alba x Populus x berolinensis]